MDVTHSAQVFRCGFSQILSRHFCFMTPFPLKHRMSRQWLQMPQFSLLQPGHFLQAKTLCRFFALHFTIAFCFNITRLLIPVIPGLDLADKADVWSVMLILELLLNELLPRMFGLLKLLFRDGFAAKKNLEFPIIDSFSLSLLALIYQFINLSI